MYRRLINFRTLVAGVLVLACVGAAIIAFRGLPFSVLSVSLGPQGTFTLTSHNGRQFDSASLRGSPYALFFGFTHCPDICPTTLLDMTNHLEALGDKADRLKVLFVSVDPERDTHDRLETYLKSFDHRIIGLTGPLPKLRELARSFRARFRRVATPSGYTMDHTASVFLIDANGRFFGTLDLQESVTSQRNKLRRLVR